MSELLRWCGAVSLIILLTLLPLARCKPGQPPYLNKFLVKQSPGGTYEATLYNYGDGGSGFLGATASTPMYVNVRRRGVPFHPKQGQVLQMWHGYKARLTWETEDRLRIEYTAEADVTKRVTWIDGVTVRSGPATSPLPEPYKAVSFRYKP